MPTYLCHGFRWNRRSIRVYVVVQNLDDAAPEWIIKRGSARSLIGSFYNLFDFLPDCNVPVTRPSSREPRSHSVSRNMDHSNTGANGNSNGNRDDDDASSHHTMQSSRSEGRSRSQTQTQTQTQSQSQSRQSQNTAALFHKQSQTFDHRDQETPTGPQRQRESSNSSRKRSRSDRSQTSSLSQPHPSTAYHQNHHHVPPSPPSSQPGFPSVSQMSDSSSSSSSADPVLSQDWSPVKLLEEYDPANLDEVSRPYAYVADYVARIDASCSIVEEIQRYESRVRQSSTPAVTGPSSDEMLCAKRDTTKLGKGAGWFEMLRDQLQRGEDIRWFVVVNGDEERAWPVDPPPPEPESRSSVIHHSQYTHQQLVFDGQDRDVETRRAQLRKELGYEQGGVDKLLDRRLERRPKPPEKELPPLRTKMSHNRLISSPPKTPKTPGKASFKRLFSRSKTTEEVLP